MATGYSDTPQTLEELLQQCQEWDGAISRVVPHFVYNDVQPNEFTPPRLEAVSVWVDDENDPEAEDYEQLWRLTSVGWVRLFDGGGDASTSGGSVMTGRS